MTTSATYLRSAWSKTGARVEMGTITPAVTLELSEDLDTIWTATCPICPTLVPAKKWARSSTEKEQAVRQLKSHVASQHKNEQGRLDGMV